MAIHDAAANINLVMQEALIIALEELFQSTTAEDSTALVGYINTIRESYNMFHLSDAQLVSKLWTEMRMDPSKNVVSNLMHTTTSFLLEMENPEVGYKHLAERMVPYSNNSTIVDKELIGKSPKLDDLVKYFANNEWLFFMIFAALNMRLVNTVVQKYVPRVPGGKGAA